MYSVFRATSLLPPHSLLYRTQLEEGGAIQPQGNVSQFRGGHLSVPIPPSRFPHPNTENDAHESRVAISTTPDAIVSDRQTSPLKLLMVGASLDISPFKWPK